jgi:hypothetical protein
MIPDSKHVHVQDIENGKNQRYKQNKIWVITQQEKSTVVSDFYVLYEPLVGISFAIHLFQFIPKKRSGIKTKCRVYNGKADFD